MPKPIVYKHCQEKARVLPTEILAPDELLNRGRLFLGCLDAAADYFYMRDCQAGPGTGGGGSPYKHIHT